MPEREPVLSVRDLVVEFPVPGGSLRAVNGVSFDVFPGEVLGIVGESGSGKSLTMLAVMGLLPDGARIASGTVTFRGRDMVNMSIRDRCEILGRDIAMIFQDPMTSLNPVQRVGAQLAEMVRSHCRTLSRRQARARALELLEMVRIPDAPSRYSAYPHEFSGGMRQRVMIAMAVAHSPALLIADEPTTALDVTIQAQVLRVLSRIRSEVGASMTLITHDLGLVAEVADRIVVMYGGRVVESGTVAEIFASARHPYTVGLLASALRLDTPVEEAYAIPGQPPPIHARPSGCVFRPRCGLRQGRELCAREVPTLIATGGDGMVACHFHDETPTWARNSDLLQGALPTVTDNPL